MSAVTTPIAVTPADTRNVSAMASAVSVACAARNASSNPGSTIGGSSIPRRSWLNRASPYAVSADSPTLRPSRRTTITAAAADPLASAGAWSTTASVVGAWTSPKPVPSTASWIANTTYEVSAPHVSPIVR